ncbi:BspA family leucine-rich repeat surface protein [Candidatus Saccharibacteria bacterium]|nr:BspA family leucine-rich repeat surface protein [Candidatus Saccharibacteria bacterium]
MKNHISTPWFFLLAIAASMSATLSFQQNTHALVKPTLSASVDQSNIQINGTEVAESATSTIDKPVNVSVKTNNRSGYTITVSSATEDTALTDVNPLNEMKISSIVSPIPLKYIPANQWGLRWESEKHYYVPIQPNGHAQVIATTTAKNDTEETNTFHIGMKLNSSLRTGNYQNKLLVSITTNPVDSYVELGYSYLLRSSFGRLIGGDIDDIKHIKYSVQPPAKNITTATIHNDDVSEAPVLAWWDDSTKTIYYHSEAPKIYLPVNSNMLFDSYSNLEDIDLSPIDTSHATDFTQLFNRDRKLKKLDLSHFNTSKVTDMSWMFASCESLEELDLSSFDTKSVKSMDLMFASAKSLKNLNLTSFDTSNVTGMQSMFNGVRSLDTLDLSSFNTSKVMDFAYMFENKYNYSNPTSTENKLKTIYVSEGFTTSAIGTLINEPVFKNRTGLCGGNSTCYSSSHSNYEYMRIDRPGAPGYFTYKAKP